MKDKKTYHVEREYSSKTSAKEMVSKIILLRLNTESKGACDSELYNYGKESDIEP